MMFSQNNAKWLSKNFDLQGKLIIQRSRKWAGQSSGHSWQAAGRTFIGTINR